MKVKELVHSTAFWSLLVTNTFRNNLAETDGGEINALNSTLKFTGNNTFRNNSAEGGGGGITTLYRILQLTGNNTFRNNSAEDGGGTYALWSTLDNSALIHGGAVHTEDSTLSFEGFNIIFSGNSALYYGGGVYSKNSTLTFSGNTDFRSNSGRLQGGGIYGLATSLYFSGNSNFTANTAARGGGEYLASSFNLLSKNSTFTMGSNNATGYGGAVYVEDSDPVLYCFPDI